MYASASYVPVSSKARIFLNLVESLIYSSARPRPGQSLRSCLGLRTLDAAPDSVCLPTILRPACKGIARSSLKSTGARNRTLAARFEYIRVEENRQRNCASASFPTASLPRSQAVFGDFPRIFTKVGATQKNFREMPVLTRQTRVSAVLVSIPFRNVSTPRDRAPAATTGTNIGHGNQPRYRPQQR